MGFIGWQLYRPLINKKLSQTAKSFQAFIKGIHCSLLQNHVISNLIKTAIYFIGFGYLFTLWLFSHRHDSLSWEGFRAPLTGKVKSMEQAKLRSLDFLIGLYIDIKNHPAERISPKPPQLLIPLIRVFNVLISKWQMITASLRCRSYSWHVPKPMRIMLNWSATCLRESAH